MHVYMYVQEAQLSQTDRASPRVVESLSHLRSLEMTPSTDSIRVPIGVT